MATVLSKTNLLSSVGYNNHRHQNQRGQISLCPKSSSGFVSRSFPRLKNKSQALKSHIYGKQLVLRDDDVSPRKRWPCKNFSKAQMGLIGKTSKWWEKGVQPNMKEVTSAQDIVDSLLNAGDKLVVVDFYSPGCGGCRALHPKICQLAEMNPDVLFLQVNYEKHKSMCYSLNVHVLPFFRFYRGAHGRLCSFSCTNATIKKFKDALAKHTPDRCSIGPTKGLEEKELLALSANKDLNFSYTPKPVEPVLVPAQEEILVSEAAKGDSDSTLPLLLHSIIGLSPKEAEERNLVAAGR